MVVGDSAFCCSISVGAREAILLAPSCILSLADIQVSSLIIVLSNQIHA